MQTKLTSHNKYNSKILLNKKYWQELGFKENDKVSISKLEDGKIVVERVGDYEKLKKILNYYLKNKTKQCILNYPHKDRVKG